MKLKKQRVLVWQEGRNSGCSFVELHPPISFSLEGVTEKDSQGGVSELSLNHGADMDRNPVVCSMSFQ